MLKPLFNKTCWCHLNLNISPIPCQQDQYVFLHKLVLEFDSMPDTDRQVTDIQEMSTEEMWAYFTECCTLL